MSDEPRTHRFGPPEGGPAFGGLGWDQVAAVACGVALAVLALRALAAPGSLALAVAAAGAGMAAGLVPIAGRPPVGWLPVVGAHALRLMSGSRRYRARGQAHAFPGARTAPPGLPPELRGLRLLAVEAPGGLVGVAREGEAMTAVLAVRGGPFVLLDAAERDRRASGLAAVLASLARPGSPVSRVQWVERTHAQSPDALGRHLAEGCALPAEHRAVRSYREALADAGPLARRHEVLIALRVSRRRAARLVRGAGGGERGTTAVLVRELGQLARRLRAAEVEVEGALTPRLLARALRLGLDPAAAAQAPVPGDERAAGVVGPLAREEGWGAVRADGSVHATYWVAGWPAVEVPADVLAPLLLGTTCRRAVSVVMEPLDPRRALRRVEGARTEEASDDELRARLGFLATARRRRRREALEAEERELAEGEAAFRFSGFVTVSAGSGEVLDAACAEVEQAAQMSRLELRRMWGEQAAALTLTLPLARGLR